MYSICIVADESSQTGYRNCLCVACCELLPKFQEATKIKLKIETVCYTDIEDYI